MLNIVRMDLFRLFKSKSFYIITIIFVFTIMWMVNSASCDLYMGHVTKLSAPPRTLSSSGYIPLIGIMDMCPDLLLTEQGDTSLLHMVSYLMNSFIVRIFPVIFIVLFISGDSSSGFIKNIACCVKRRRFIVFSKIISMSFFILFEFLVLLITTELTCLSVIDNYSHKITLEQLKYLGAQFLLYSAYTTIIILVTYTLKNAAISLIVNLCLCCNVFTILLLGLPFYFKLYELYDLACKLVELTVVQNMRIIWINAPFEIYIRAILVSIAAILVYSSLNSVLIEKRDI